MALYFFWCSLLKENVCLPSHGIHKVHILLRTMRELLGSQEVQRVAKERGSAIVVSSLCVCVCVRGVHDGQKQQGSWTQAARRHDWVAKQTGQQPYDSCQPIAAFPSSMPLWIRRTGKTPLFWEWLLLCRNREWMQTTRRPLFVCSTITQRPYFSQT